MASLHTINQSPKHADIWSKLIELCSTNDSLILLENAVYAVESSDLIERVTNLINQHNVQAYVVADDAKARGLSITGPFRAASYEDFVKLSTEHQRVITWSAE